MILKLTKMPVDSRKSTGSLEILDRLVRSTCRIVLSRKQLFGQRTDDKMPPPPTLHCSSSFVINSTFCAASAVKWIIGVVFPPKVWRSWRFRSRHPAVFYQNKSATYAWQQDGGHELLFARLLPFLREGPQGCSPCVVEQHDRTSWEEKTRVSCVLRGTLVTVLMGENSRSVQEP